MIGQDLTARVLHERVLEAQRLPELERMTEHDVNIAMDTIRDLAVVLGNELEARYRDFDKARFNKAVKGEL